MHKKLGKILSSSLLAATMLTTATVSFVAPMSASAGNMLGQSNFDDGIGLPWHTCETNPAKQTFDISGGTYNVEIKNNDGPESRWDLQLRHRVNFIQKSAITAVRLKFGTMIWVQTARTSMLLGTA